MKDKKILFEIATPSGSEIDPPSTVTDNFPKTTLLSIIGTLFLIFLNFYTFLALDSLWKVNLQFGLNIRSDRSMS